MTTTAVKNCSSSSRRRGDSAVVVVGGEIEQTGAGHGRGPQSASTSRSETTIGQWSLSR